MSKNAFHIESKFKPSLDQAKAVDALSKGFLNDKKDQVLLGVTGSGKTFTIACVIEKLQKPTLVIAPNKTLAAQLYGEMRELFPKNAVEYFVSYYDYYQPEAYIPKTDTYIAKDASINEVIDKMRHSATQSLFERRDVIIVSSVSCIYGLGDAQVYDNFAYSINVGDKLSLSDLSKKLIYMQYTRNQMVLNRGNFRFTGDTVQIIPSHMEDKAWQISMFGDEVESIDEIDLLTGKKAKNYTFVKIYPNSHHLASSESIRTSIPLIKEELKERVKFFKEHDKHLEAQRIKERTQSDIEAMVTQGFCQGIENYSRYMNGRNPGEPPPTLFEYLPEDSLLVIDESHVVVPQIGGMYRGDRARKENLSEFGFRLPSCKDNRPLKFEEWEKMRPNTIFVSATPGKWEMEAVSGNTVEQIIRPTGLLDPLCEVRPSFHQIDDIIKECHDNIACNERVIITTLTKKMAENLNDYMLECNLKVKYLHCDIENLERIDIIQKFREGEFDIIIGINLLREGLDIPECSLVVILDADKQGFLRSCNSLIQTIGRAARNVNGRVIMYADKITEAMEKALEETKRRRDIQDIFNKKHGITPRTVGKSLTKSEGFTAYKKMDSKRSKLETEILKDINNPKKAAAEIQKVKQAMLVASGNLEFEKAIELRNKLQILESYLF